MGFEPVSCGFQFKFDNHSFRVRMKATTQRPPSFVRRLNSSLAAQQILAPHSNVLSLEWVLQFKFSFSRFMLIRFCCCCCCVVAAVVVVVALLHQNGSPDNISKSVRIHVSNLSPLNVCSNSNQTCLPIKNPIIWEKSSSSSLSTFPKVKTSDSLGL